MTIYHITLRDRETQTVVGYYDGSWTTDRCRAALSLSVMRRKLTPLGCGIDARVTLNSLRSRRAPPTTSHSSAAFSGNLSPVSAR